MIASPASGPSAIATATARLSSTTGDAVICGELAVEAGDLVPVGVGRVARGRVARRDRGLHLVRAGPPRRSARSSIATASAIGSVVPEAAILLRRAARGRRPRRREPARRASCSSISASSPIASGSSGISPASVRAEPDRLCAQALTHEVGAGGGGVALVEQEVEHGEHRARALRQQMRGRHPVRDAGVADLVLRAHEPLRHRRLRHQERASDLGGGQPGERAQRQRDLRVDRERRVAAREDQPQAVVFDAAVVGVGTGSSPDESTVTSRSFDAPVVTAPGAVDRPVAGGRGEPRAGIARDAVASPMFEGEHEGVLRAFLGHVPVAGDADQRRDDPAPLLPERGRDCRGGRRVGHVRRHISQIGLTSIEPNRAPGILAAISMASSRSLQSTTK